MKIHLSLYAIFFPKIFAVTPKHMNICQLHIYKLKYGYDMTLLRC